MNDFRFQRSQQQIREENLCGFKRGRFYLVPEVLKGNNFTEKSFCWCFGCLLFELLTGEIPFNSSSLHETFQQVLSGRLTIPDWITDLDTLSLLKSLLSVEPSSRPTLLKLKNHSFFSSFKWDSLYNKQYCVRLPMEFIQSTHQSIPRSSMKLFPENNAGNASMNITGTYHNHVDTFIASEEFPSLEGYTIQIPTENPSASFNRNDVLF